MIRLDINTETKATKVIGYVPLDLGIDKDLGDDFILPVCGVVYKICEVKFKR